MKTTNLDAKIEHIRSWYETAFEEKGEDFAKKLISDEIKQLIREQRIEELEWVANYTVPAIEYKGTKTIAVIEPQRIIDRIQALTYSHKEEDK